MNEIKLWTPLLKTSSPGVGNASSGGTPASVGHSHPAPTTPSAAPRVLEINIGVGTSVKRHPNMRSAARSGLSRRLILVVFELVFVLRLGGPTPSEAAGRLLSVLPKA